MTITITTLVIGETPDDLQVYHSFNEDHDAANRELVAQIPTEKGIFYLSEAKGIFPIFSYTKKQVILHSVHTTTLI